MKAKLVIFFVAVFCMITVITEMSFAGANENATVQVKLLRQSQLATWTSSTQNADTLQNIAEGESFWVKIYALNVTDLFGWQVDITVNKNYLEYAPANSHIFLSDAGEKNILLQKDASGLSSSDVMTAANVYYAETGNIVLSYLFDSGTKHSNPALASDTGFVAELKLTAKTGVRIGQQDIISLTKVLFTDITGLTDEIPGVGLDSGTVTFTPVELSTFSSIVIGEKDVKLEWATTSETNNFGFYVERSADNVTFESIQFVEGSGTTTEERSYSYTDNSVNSGTYYYRLKFVAYDGSISYSDVLQVEIGLPGTYELAQNYPNPFNPSTTIKFSLKETGFVELRVYSIVGQLVETLVQREMPAGFHSINFDASRLASGIYFYSLKANSFSDIKKMVFVK